MEIGCDVVGVDLSSEFVAAAREKGVNAQCMDGQKLFFNREFDAVFSNAGLHWMTDPEAVIGGVYRALKPSEDLWENLVAVESRLYRRSLEPDTAGIRS